MTDLLRHSEGIWRSIYVFALIKEHYRIIEWFKKEMKKLKIEGYSWCHYGEVRGPVPVLCEKEHITFRVDFPGTTSYNSFRADLEKTEWKWEDHGYDEPLWVKRAYELGTKLYEMVMETTKGPDVNMNNNFMRILLHGFFNDAHMNSKEETEFYLFLFQSYLTARYGLRPGGVNDSIP